MMLTFPHSFFPFDFDFEFTLYDVKQNFLLLFKVSCFAENLIKSFVKTSCEIATMSFKSVPTVVRFSAGYQFAASILVCIQVSHPDVF